MIGRRAAIAVWALALLAAGLVVGSARVGSDATVFLPGGASADQRLIVDELRQGAASRVLLIAVGDTDDDQRAADRLGARLERTGRFLLVATRPDAGALESRSRLFRYRYLLSDRVDAGSFEAGALELGFAHLTERLRGGWVDERRAAADPTGEFRHVLQRVLGDGSEDDGPWRTSDGRPVILAVPRAEPYALDEQARTLERIRSEAEALESAPSLQISGAPAIAVSTRATIQGEALRVSLLAVLAVLGVLAFALRSVRAVALCLLPAASGLLMGVAAVVLAFGQVHGITLAFAATLLGMTVDYPMHLLWRGRSQALPPAARGMRRLLVAGVGSSALGFVALGLAAFPGLQQLALLTTVGIVVAGAVTYWILPALGGPGAPTLASPPRPPGRGPRLLGPALAGGLAVLGGAMAGLVDLGTDLSALSPVPADVRTVDRELRAAVGVAAPRYAVRVTGDTREQALRRTERTVRALEKGRRLRELDRYRAATAVVPSARTQRARQRALPTGERLTTAVHQAVRGLPLRPTAFEPFVAAVDGSRALSPLVPDALPSGFLRQWLDSHLFPFAGSWTSIVSLAGVHDAGSVAARVASLDGTAFLDRVAITNTMVTHYQKEAVRHFTLGALLILVALAVTLRDARRVARVMLVVAGAVGGTVAVLALTGATLSLFEVVSLLLVVGLGVDYGVFAGSGETAGRDSVTVCAATTVSAFAILATAEVPVLRDIGLTVAVGTGLAWALAQLMAPARPASDRGEWA